MKKLNVSKKTIMKWVNALRSGNYKQTQNKLQDENGYCCLGVACDIFIKKGKISFDEKGFIAGAMPRYQKNSPKWLKEINDDFHKKSNKLTLSGLNDSVYVEASEKVFLERFNFDEIADLIQLVYIEGAL